MVINLIFRVDLAMLIRDVINVIIKGVGLLDASLIWKLSWCLLRPLKQVLRKEAIRSVPPQGSLCPVCELQSVWSSQGHLKEKLFHLWVCGNLYKRTSIFGLTGSVLMETIWVEVSSLWFSIFWNQDVKDCTLGSVPSHIVQLLLSCAVFY